MLDGLGPEPKTGSNLGRILVAAATLAQKENDFEVGARLIEAAYSWFEEQEQKEER
jgi:hypothetical protein